MDTLPKTTKLVAIVIAVELLARRTLVFAQNSIDVLPGPGNDVILEDEFRTVTSGPFYASSTNQKLKVVSDIPVSVLRYNDQKYLIDETPIDPGEAYVYVKTNCPNRFDEDSFRLRTDENSEGLVKRIRVKNSSRRGKQQLRANSFLKPSSFLANWQYTSFWCERDAAEARNGGGGGRRQLFTRGSLDRGLAGRGRRKRGRRGRRGTTKCKANLEILIDGCASDVEVKAPQVRSIGVRLRDEASSENSSDECTTDYEALLTFPAQRSERFNTRTANIPRLSDDECSRAIEGRPFLDSDRNQLQAAPSYVGVESASWGGSTMQQPHQSCASNMSNPTDSPNPAVSMSQEIGATWTRRGLGEHASVASFAAFTLALMTNNAPPDLIRDSLRAALDEVNHAEMSFEVASLFVGQGVEPGPLPPSIHHFQQDVMTLALGAAQEGCIDETLSALAAAAEADHYGNTDSGISSADAVLLKERLSSIAMDESRHSALAWRTVRWACSVDEHACEAVMNKVLSPSKLSNAAQRRFPSGELRLEWEKIYNYLVPFVIGGEGSKGGSAPPLECNERRDNGTEMYKSMAEKIVEEIIEGVACS